MRIHTIGCLLGLLGLAACVPAAAPVAEVSVRATALPLQGAASTPALALSQTPDQGAPPSSLAFFPPTAESAPPPTATPASAEAATSVPLQTVQDYIIQSGDTLLGLALRFDLPMAALQLQNSLGMSTDLVAGDTLRIPPKVGWETASPFWVVYDVQEGDTLLDIAARFGFDVSVLQNVNGLGDADWLSIGQPLVMPLEGPADLAVLAAAPVEMAAAADAPAADAPADTQPAADLVATTAGADALADTPADTPAEVPAELPAAAAPVSAAAAPPPADIAAWPAEVFSLINAERAAYGLPPLAWNSVLANAAQSHANDCLARGWCSHTGSDGSTMKERIIRAGYSPTRWSECWAWYGSPAQAVYAWMDEVPPNDPHRRTILSSWLTEVGVGVVPAPDHGYYFIADFGMP